MSSTLSTTVSETPLMDRMAVLAARDRNEDDMVQHIIQHAADAADDYRHHSPVVLPLSATGKPSCVLCGDVVACRHQMPVMTVLPLDVV